MIHEAYETLSDPVKRQAYDTGRPAARPNREQGSEETYRPSRASSARKEDKRGALRYLRSACKLALRGILLLLIPFLWFLKVVLRLVSAATTVVAALLAAIAAIGFVVGIGLALFGDAGWLPVILFGVLGGVCVIVYQFADYICEPYENLVDNISDFVRYG